VATVALDGVDLEVPRGTFLAVTGPSGSGKTTLLNCLSGLDNIDGGRVLLDGIDLKSLDEASRSRLRARQTGFVFQAFNLISVFTALENVKLPLLLTGMSSRAASTEASLMLERVGLGHRLGHRPAELSGGEQQRVAIARALVGRPAVVWADEPTGNLDSQTASEVLALFKEMHDEEGQTLVLVTHDASIAATADRVAEMVDGRLAPDLPAQERALES
jgi:putative ABC transport system ATP-binding protein